ALADALEEGSHVEVPPVGRQIDAVRIARVGITDDRPVVLVDHPVAVLVLEDDVAGAGNVAGWLRMAVDLLLRLEEARCLEAVPGANRVAYLDDGLVGDVRSCAVEV